MIVQNGTRDLRCAATITAGDRHRISVRIGLQPTNQWFLLLLARAPNAQFRAMGRPARGLRGRTPAHAACHRGFEESSLSLRLIGPRRTCLSHAAVLCCANVARSPQWRSGRAGDGPGHWQTFSCIPIHMAMPKRGSSGRHPQRPPSWNRRRCAPAPASST